MNIAGENGGDAEFEEFVSEAGDVQIGESNKAPGDDAPPEKKPLTGAAKAAHEAKQARQAGADGIEEGGQGGADDGNDDGIEEETDGKKPQKASDRIRELNRRLRESERARERDMAALRAEFSAKQNPSGQSGGNGGNQEEGPAAPDPSDAAKYPLGHLDDRYIEDKLEWLAEKKAAKQADANLRRQEETRQQETQRQAQERLQETVVTLTTAGEDLFDDFQEKVVDAGMKGEWKLSQPTFEAAAEVDHGAEILYELASDPKEAERVSKLSPRQQILFVEGRNTELAAKRTPRKKPGAGAPPTTQTRGANSSHRINPATDNLDDFEKAWEADAKANK